MLVRSDIDVKTIGKMAALPDDMSPLQIGSEGRYHGTHFGVIGRLKIGWRDGMWNEWHILLDSGERAWMARPRVPSASASKRKAWTTRTEITSPAG